jgi:hypothetical protein
MEQDPSGYVNGDDLYQFVEGNPIAQEDASGLKLTLINARANREDGENFSNDEGEGGAKWKDAIDANSQVVSGAIQSIKERVSDADWAQGLKDNTIKWNGKPVDWTKDKYLSELEREKDMKILKMVKGTLADLVDRAKQEKAENSEPWDQTGVFYHFDGAIFDQGHSLFPDETVSVDAALKAFRAIGVYSFSCHANGKDLYIQRVRIDPPTFSRAKTSCASFVPAKMSAADTNERAEQLGN